MKTRYALNPVNRECGCLDQAEKKMIKSESKFRLIVYGMLSLKKKKKRLQQHNNSVAHPSPHFLSQYAFKDLSQNKPVAEMATEKT